MHIQKIVINNFKIYHGENILSFPIENKGNICVISGNNGYGKTTLLTALVWCLYGNQIQEVDEFFKEKISVIGGYPTFLKSCLNKVSRDENVSEFSVSIHFRGVELPGIFCDTLQITRKFDIRKTKDELEIYLDEIPNELVDEMGKQLFIQDFVLPKELAKFFFFDAEKIVRLAEIQSLHEKRVLSQAYSEALGIKRYVDLRESLIDLKIRFRKKSASDSDKVLFETLGKEIKSFEKSINGLQDKKEKLLQEKDELKTRVDEIQEKLLREGNTYSSSEIDKLRERRNDLSEKIKELQNEFRDLFDLAPFAIMGNVLVNIKSQLEKEEKTSNHYSNQENLKTQTQNILNALKRDDTPITKDIPERIKAYYLQTVNELMDKYLIKETEVVEKDIVILHNFNVDEMKKFQSVFTTLRTKYKQTIQKFNSELTYVKNEYDEVSKALKNIESKIKDPLIRKFRVERSEYENRIRLIDEETLTISQEIGKIENEQLTKNRILDEITQKIKVDESFIEKDKLITRLVSELDEFIYQIQERKKSSFEKKLLENISLLMHKKHFIAGVNVRFKDDLIEITLLDSTGKEIKKEELSKGEQQLYATALLKSLVEESGIHFPVVVDSPLQKFDEQHSQNVISFFYPKISEQVIILPLREKELSEKEYKLLSEHIVCSYVIENNGDSSSSFKDIKPEYLFVKATG